LQTVLTLKHIFSNYALNIYYYLWCHSQYR